MKLLLATFLFFIQLTCYSQLSTQESLSILRKQKKTQLQKQNIDSVILISLQILSLYEKERNLDKVLKYQSLIAKYYRNNKNFTSAFRYHNLAYQTSLLVNNGNKAIENLNWNSLIQKKYGDLDASEKTAITALKIADTLSDSISSVKHKIRLFNHLGQTTRAKKEFKDAISWYKKALDLTQSVSQINKIHLNIANLYRDLRKFDKAFEVYIQLLKSKIPKDSLRFTAKIIDNYAYSKFKSGDLTIEKELLKALSFRGSTNNYSELNASYIHLTEFYIKTKQTKNAKKFALKAYLLGKKIKNTSYQLEALSFLIKLSPNSKYSLEGYLLLDSLITSQKKSNYLYSKVKYQTEENKREILILKTKTVEKDLKLIQEKNKLIWLIAIVGVLVLLVLFINYYRKKQTQVAKIKERHRTQKKLSKELHDEVGNNLFHLMHQMQQQSQNTAHLKTIDEVYHKIRDFSRSQHVETGQAFGDDLIDLLQSYANDHIKIVVDKLTPDFWNPISATTKEELYFVLKELMTNMSKHSEASFVAITFSKQKKHLQINYVDNGKGVDLSQISSKNGLQNVENRVKDLQGTITFDSKPSLGFKTKIKVPL